MKTKVYSAAPKLFLVAMLAVAKVTDASQFHGKGLGWRIAFYPLGTLIVPIVWILYRRIKGAQTPFPLVADLLITMPFVIDTAGNWLNLFDQISWWDDLMHFVLWFSLIAGIAEIAKRDPKMTRWHLFFVAAGLGALFAIWWEGGEYLAFVQKNPTESLSAYRDTMGDLMLGSTGGILAAILSARLWRRQ